VHGRDEQPTGPQRTSDLREQRPVQEVEVAHQVVLALDAEAGRLDVCDLPQDPLETPRLYATSSIRCTPTREPSMACTFHPRSARKMACRPAPQARSNALPGVTPSIACGSGGEGT